MEPDPVFTEAIEGTARRTNLYVTRVGRDYCVVKARDGDPNVAFAAAERNAQRVARLEEAMI